MHVPRRLGLQRQSRIVIAMRLAGIKCSWRGIIIGSVVKPGDARKQPVELALLFKPKE